MPVGIPPSHNAHRYARDGGGRPDRRVELADALRAFADDLLETGDARLALERAFRWGYQDEAGEHIAGLQEQLQELRHQRDRLLRHIEHQSFLDALAPELDRLDELEQESTGEPSGESGESPLDRLADRLDQGYQSPDAQAEFDSLVAELQASAAVNGAGGGDAEQSRRGGGGQPGSATGPLQSARAAKADRVRRMLFEGGVPAADRQAATGHWRSEPRASNPVRHAADDLHTLAELDRLEATLERLERIGSVTAIADADLRELEAAGNGDAAAWLQDWQGAVAAAAAAGEGRQFVLPPEVISEIGRDLLKGLFRNASSPVTGEHHTSTSGNAGDFADETIAWEPGKPLDLNLVTTLSNAVRRTGAAGAGRIALHPDDFAVVERTATTAVSTVLAVDRSRSMGQSGAWTAAKKVSLAMHELIRQSYPRDSLDIVAFSSSAAPVGFTEIPQMRWDEFEHGTHLQAALELGRRLHRRNRAGTRQIVVITDGEPTLATIAGEEVFASPPTAEVLNATMAEVVRCTRESIVINIVLLGGDSGVTTFAEQVARVNRGRIFVATNESLGSYILRDYIAR